jgi:hypothetical protein
LRITRKLDSEESTLLASLALAHGVALAFVFGWACAMRMK